MKQVAVMGLGDFGTALARALRDNKVAVLAVDSNPARVESLQDELDHIVTADMTQAAALEELGLARMDAVVVAASSPMSTSILTVLRLKDLGVERIIAKAENEDHAKVLDALGVSDIVIPDQFSATRLANRISWTNVVEMVELSSGCSIMELAPPASVVGKTLRNSELRSRYGVEVLAIRSGADMPLKAIPNPDEVIGEDSMLLVFGEHDNIARLREEAVKRRT